ncbi:hypothetical protein [Paenibacillus rubinfantis]|uniref:hypothetical protein n=1 Tax=Paenibacillus rubinfantis TaxID=1720296 RepID=UPI00073EFF74|nr:hypothetical protein [Paenibacillus rubinfantis]
MTTQKRRLRWGWLAAVILSLFMAFSLPSFISSPVQAESRGEETLETDFSTMQYKVSLRLNPTTSHGKLFIDRTPHQLDTVPALISFMLLAPWARFRPLFCLLLRQLLLMPIKFTSMFVDEPHTLKSHKSNFTIHIIEMMT